MAHSAAVMTETSDELRRNSQDLAYGQPQGEVAQLCRQSLDQDDRVHSAELMATAERLVNQLNENLSQQADQWSLLAIVVRNLAQTIGHLDHAAALDLYSTEIDTPTHTTGTTKSPSQQESTTAQTDKSSPAVTKRTAWPRNTIGR